LWFEFKEVPVVGHIRVGNFKEPIGLEHLTSSRYLDFMERSFLQDAYFGPFNNGFSPGIMIFDTSHDKRLHYDLGIFKNTTNVFGFGVGGGEYAVTGRLGYLVWYDEPSQGRYLAHLGISGSHRDLDDGRIRIRSRGSLRNGPGVLNPVLADTGFFFGDDQDLLGLEAAAVVGPWLFQAEYTGSSVSEGFQGGRNLGTVFTHGYYMEALYFLTGEHRAYDHKVFSFGRVVPHENAFLVRTPHGICHGHGAWQVGGRYSYLDLRDDGINGGTIQDWTLGLNWFLNPNMKIQWNYVLTHREGQGGVGDGSFHGVGMRLAHDF
jgi:phosphate-selective porin OprO/OprP